MSEIAALSSIYRAKCSHGSPNFPDMYCNGALSFKVNATAAPPPAYDFAANSSTD
jgi:hypothetical protein